MQAAEASAAAPFDAEAEMIEGLRARIDAWRGSETRGRAMPGELWEASGAAAQRLGVFRVARALSLNYQTLKRRAGMADTERPAAGQADFIELPCVSAPSGGGLGDEAVVEMLAADGAKLTLHVKARSLDMAALINAFRGRA